MSKRPQSKPDAPFGHTKDGKPRKKRPGQGRKPNAVETVRTVLYIAKPQRDLLEPLRGAVNGKRGIPAGKYVGGLLNDEARRRGMIG